MTATLKRAIIFTFLLITINIANSQHINPLLLSRPWKAFWITAPNESKDGYGVYNFRKGLTMVEKPDSFVIHISADNRYKLFVNGQLASHGPARGDLYHWNFETVDIAGWLQKGINKVETVVWNDGEQRPEAQVSYRTALIIQGNSEREDIINTNNTWQCSTDKRYKPLTPQLIFTYYAAGPGELVDMRTENSTWLPAQHIFNGLPKGVFAHQFGWMLVARQIPQMELTPQRLQKVRKAEGVIVPAAFPAKPQRLQIPANSTVTLLLDQQELTNAYPTINFSKGKNATISLMYQEALYINEGNTKDWRAQNKKGNRNEVDGKRIAGKEDRIISNGDNTQQWTALWWRTFRYIRLQVTTEEDPLLINDISSIFTGYPFRYNASFNAGNNNLKDILTTGWRTARLCANETYMDCPYYEQLQYIGDTRIQGLVSLYNSGDDRLLKNAIIQFDQSRMAEGLTMSRYPTANSQEIPPFSLWWIGMLHDYWRYGRDTSFIKNMLPGARQVLWFFSKHQQHGGLLRDLPYWTFTDWATDEGWNNGMAPFGKNGHSAALDLQLLLAYQTAAELEKNLGMKDYEKLYLREAEKLKKAINAGYWSADRKLFADTPEKNSFSQHVNTLAILTKLVDSNTELMLAKSLLIDTTLTQATIYFKYYLHRALIKARQGDDYLNWLGAWQNNLANGLTTWAEITDINAARSDCHAWGSHPNIEFFRTVLGIDSGAPGFSKVNITPHLGTLTDASGDIPHPAGKVSVDYKLKNSKWNINISLPENTPGQLNWKGEIFHLKPGNNHYVL